MFKAIEIDGEPYWDGGYAGNPTLTPLVRESDAHDTILVQINPRERPEPPRTANEILNRLITDKLADFGASSKLNAEWSFVGMLKEEGRRCADASLATHDEDLGQRSTADLDVLLAEC